MRTWLTVLTVALAVPSALWSAGPAAAEPTTTDAVCGAFRMGESPGQIIERLQRNDARNNYWRARDGTVWPIIDGDCD
ncbi:hypothetical protein KIH27_00785 [Mycobacterium sp. M1]|uniref:Uncharacterized protein n=1 Tax=Mycolicibacter acidiphilus TaxID=2835306 RepID=A0ABS5REW1_9MYCO|nr:hypothetical protein [Mycolicibacter acidiphilus]MBS9532118.1 hypothetical protein [Mycolicibacter acidiphilus]